MISGHFMNYSSPIVFAMIKRASISVVFLTMMLLTILVGGLFSLGVTVNDSLVE
jgi:hypothetical protein